MAGNGSCPLTLTSTTIFPPHTPSPLQYACLQASDGAHQLVEVAVDEERDAHVEVRPRHGQEAPVVGGWGAMWHGHK